MALCLLGADAKADPVDWHLDADILAAVPIDLALGITMETPNRLRLSTALGFMPGTYVDLINATATGADWYSDDTADLISDTLSSSMVWSVWAGYRPVAKWGLFFDFGYSLVALGGGASTEALISASTGVKPPPQSPFTGPGPVIPGPGGPSGTTAEEDVEYTVDSTLHMLRLRIGWAWWLGDALHLQASLGGGYTVSSDTTVDPPAETGQPGVDAVRRGFADDAAKELDDIYGSYVHTPTLGLALGYRFF